MRKIPPNTKCNRLVANLDTPWPGDRALSPQELARCPGDKHRLVGTFGGFFGETERQTQISSKNLIANWLIFRMAGIFNISDGKVPLDGRLGTFTLPSKKAHGF